MTGDALINFRLREAGKLLRPLELFVGVDFACGCIHRGGRYTKSYKSKKLKEVSTVNSKSITFPFSLILLASACSTSETSRKVEIAQTTSHATAAAYAGPKSAIIIANFDNKSSYGNGLFSDGEDRLGSQAKTILMAHLRRTNRFSLMDRGNMNAIAKESAIAGKKQKLKAGKYAVTGDVVEFGRKEVGSMAAWGILGKGKKQVAYSKVTLNVVDVQTSEVVVSVSGAGEFVLSEQDVLGFGSYAGYDSTLNGKVLDLAVRESVDNLVKSIEQGEWKPGS